MHFHAPWRRCFAYGDSENSAAVWNKFWQPCLCLLLLFVSAIVRCWYSLANWIIEWTIRISISTDWNKSKFVNTSNLYQQTLQLPSHFPHFRNQTKKTHPDFTSITPSFFLVKPMRFAKHITITTHRKKNTFQIFFVKEKSPWKPKWGLMEIVLIIFCNLAIFITSKTPDGVWLSITAISTSECLMPGGKGVFFPVGLPGRGFWSRIFFFGGGTNKFLGGVFWRRFLVGNADPKF